jgi:hypothetical protein
MVPSLSLFLLFFIPPSSSSWLTYPEGTCLRNHNNLVGTTIDVEDCKAMCIIQMLFFCCSIETVPLPIAGFSCTLSEATIAQYPEDSETPCLFASDVQYYERSLKGMVISGRIIVTVPVLYLTTDE